MDFELTDEQRALRESTRALIAATAPVAATRAMLDSGADFDPRLWRSGATMGWTALTVPEADGGLGLSLIDLTLVAIEHGRQVLPSPLMPTVAVADAVSRAGGDDMRASLLPALLDGTATAAWSFAEHGRPWSTAGIRATAVTHADGFLIDGAKVNVQDAASATTLLVDVVLAGEPARFLVPADAAGLTIRRQRTIDLTRALDEVTFDGVRVGPAALLSAGERARGGIARTAALMTILTCAELVGVGERLLDMTVAYVKERVQFGRPVGSFQAVKHKCATMRMWVQATTAATYHAAMTYDAAANCGDLGDLGDTVDDVAHAVSVAKAYASDAITRTAGEALQLHGGIGFTWEHDLHLYLRRARSNALSCGDATHHREVLCTSLAATRAG